MSSDYDDGLLHQAIINIKANDLVLGRHYLEMALDLADDRETITQANYWMSQITSDPVEKRNYLEETLANDPTHPEARRALAILDGKIRADEIVNPDALPPQASGSEQSSADRFTCPKCGGRMVFDGDGKTLICEYCARNQVLKGSTPQFEQDFILAMATGKGHRTPVMQRTFNCQGCGAHFILPAQEISVVCAYCGSAQVVALTKELLEPDSIIPMAVNKDRVMQVLSAWVEKHKLASGARFQQPRGMYLPIWTFDLMGSIPWNGYVYHDKQKVPVSGEETASFNDIAIPGVRRLSDLLPKILADFDTSNAPAYDEHYLSGWPAEVNESSMSDASLEARKQAVERTRARIRSDKGYINDLSYSTSNLSVLSFKLILIPLWYGLYTFEGHDYRYVINGQTGKIYGETKNQGILSWLDNILGE
jgi:hypothetical protein